MKLSSTSILALLASGIVAQRPKDVSVCDYYAEQVRPTQYQSPPPLSLANHHEDPRQQHNLNSKTPSRQVDEHRGPRKL